MFIFQSWLNVTKNKIMSDFFPFLRNSLIFSVHREKEMEDKKRKEKVSAKEPFVFFHLMKYNLKVCDRYRWKFTWWQVHDWTGKKMLYQTLTLTLLWLVPKAKLLHDEEPYLFVHLSFQQEKKAEEVGDLPYTGNFMRIFPWLLCECDSSMKYFILHLYYCMVFLSNDLPETLYHLH